MSTQPARHEDGVDGTDKSASRASAKPGAAKPQPSTRASTMALSLGDGTPTTVHMPVDGSTLRLHKHGSPAGGRRPKLSALQRSSSTMPTANLVTDNIDRTTWKIGVLKKHPNIKELKERIQPMERAISFGSTYYSKSAEIGAGVSPLTLIELIHQHLKYEGLSRSVHALEEESKEDYTAHDLDESRLITLIKIVLKDVEKLLHNTIGDGYNPTQTEPDLEVILNNLGLLEEEELGEDVNLWDEPSGNIVYDTKTTPGTPDGMKPPPVIKSASLNKLVEVLTAVESPDTKFVQTFLTTYQSFTTPETLFAKLIQRYNVPPKPASSAQSDAEYEDGVIAPIRLRVVITMRLWINQQWGDFADNEKLVQSLRYFAENTLLADGPPGLSAQLCNILNRKLRSPSQTGSRSDMSAMPASALTPPEPKINPKTIFSPTLSVFDVDEEELARQLTLVEFQHFSAIRSSELLKQSWSKPKLKHRSPNVCKMTDRFNDFANWVAHSILQEPKVRGRVRMMVKFIKLAEHLRNMNNFHSTMAILAALNMSAIYRLNHTKAELPPSTDRVFMELERVMGHANGYRVYRDILDSLRNQTCIPYMGVYLTDLTLMDESPDNLNGLINWGKRTLLHNVIGKIQHFQNSPPNFYLIPQITTFFESYPRMHEDDLSRLSAIREPKGKPRTEIE